MDQIYLGWLKKWYAKYPAAVIVGWVAGNLYGWDYIAMRVAELLK